MVHLYLKEWLMMVNVYALELKTVAILMVTGGYWLVNNPPP